MSTPRPLILDEQLRDIALLSIPEAAKLWCTSRATIYRLIERGELRFVLLGSDKRIPATEMRAWMHRHLAHPSPTALRAVRRPSRPA